jgi:hypothetical protein
MTSNAAAQLAILADALTEIVDLASGGPKLAAAGALDLLARAGDLAAEAPLPSRHDGALAAVSRRKPPRLSRFVVVR